MDAEQVLAFRLARLGLTRQAEELAEVGYTVIERAVSEEMADELREVVQREVLAHHPFTTNGLLLRDRLFEEVALQPAACAAAESVVGREWPLVHSGDVVNGTRAWHRRCGARRVRHPRGL